MNLAATRIEDLPTPTLLLDLDVLERNLDFMQARADSLGVRLRPHIKTHKCLEIGEMQRLRGASGITVSTLEEARTFANAGFDDITWAFPLNPSRLAEVEEIAEAVDLGLTVDTAEAIDALEETGRTLSTWLKIDCGYGRAGVDPTTEEAMTLARRLAESRTLRFRGCLTHAGHTYAAHSPDEVAEVAETERRVMVAFGDRMDAEGIAQRDLSVGSTPGMSLVRSLEGIQEARPGNYALYDYTQSVLGSCTVEQCAATVLSTVVSSRAGRDRSIADCGALVVSKDTGPDRPVHYGRIFETLDGGGLHDDLRIATVSQEHAVISGSIAPGTKLRILPNHSCLTVAQFDSFTVIRGNVVTDRWRIWRDRGAARARLHTGQTS